MRSSAQPPRTASCSSGLGCPGSTSAGTWATRVEASTCRPTLDAIFATLGGDEVAQAGKRVTPLTGDVVHRSSGTFVEVDEHQHVTSHRRRALALHPGDQPVGFDLAEHVARRESWGPRADRYYASKAAVGFGIGGRQRQRASHDSLRDLVTPAMGHPPLVRAAATDRDGEQAYQHVRAHLLSPCG